MPYIPDSTNISDFGFEDGQLYNNIIDEELDIEGCHNDNDNATR